MSQNVAHNDDATESMIKGSLKTDGASDNLAGAIADAAARGGLSRKDICYDDWSGSVQVFAESIPSELHARLTGMGFERNEELSSGLCVRYSDN
jgi:hypothetical protein